MTLLLLVVKTPFHTLRYADGYELHRYKYTRRRRKTNQALANYTRTHTHTRRPNIRKQHSHDMLNVLSAQ